MVVWEVAPDRRETAGLAAAACPAVSHCYLRKACPPVWPYSLYTMVHARSKYELEATIAGLVDAVQPDRYAVLHTVKEYKKTRLRYFVESEETGR
jgi:hypothetical protein